MSSNLLGELAANNGTYFLTGSGALYSGRVDQIIVRGTGVILKRLYVTIDGEQVEVTFDYIGSNSVPDGLRITPKNDAVFTGIALDIDSENNVGLELVLSA